MKLGDFRVLTFDCYGTLIDWDTGLARALAPLAAQARRTDPDGRLLELFAKCQSRQEAATPAMPYSQLLAVAYRRLAGSLGVSATDEDARRFAGSIKDWPAFPDSVASLQYLRNHYKLAILSNVDRMSFQASHRLLQVGFDVVCTAEEIGSYKPSLRNFEYLLARLKDEFGYGKSDVLHVAQSLYHDHAPANLVGLASAWIDRRHAIGGWGATMPALSKPRYDYRFESLAGLAAAHRQESAGEA